MRIGSHVSMSAPDYLLGAVKETLSYGANAFMIYTGPPQNTRRKDVADMKVEEAFALMKENDIAPEHIVIHAPYIINLGNCTKPETFELAIDFLAQEISRVKQIGAHILVLHPGSHVNAGEQEGLDKIVSGLDIAMKDIGNVQIAIETMSGKGSEIGYQFEHIRYIIDHVQRSENIKVCMDTCHIHDTGYELTDFDAILDQFDKIIGLDRLLCMHINDSKNSRGAKKDRHANLGFGEIGFSPLCEIVHHPRVAHVVKILETPYVEERAPYKHEIAMLKSKHFDEHIIDKIKESI